MFTELNRVGRTHPKEKLTNPNKEVLPKGTYLTDRAQDTFIRPENLSFRRDIQRTPVSSVLPTPWTRRGPPPSLRKTQTNKGETQIFTSLSFKEVNRGKFDVLGGLLVRETGKKDFSSRDRTSGSGFQSRRIETNVSSVLSPGRQGSVT